MPIYEYQCANCGHHLEVIQKISDAALKNCPSCKKAALNKLLSAPSFKLEGSGWYATDFKTKKSLPESTTQETSPEAIKPDVSKDKDIKNKQKSETKTTAVADAAT